MTIFINGGSTTKYFNGYNSFQQPSAYATQYTNTTGGTTTINTIKDTAITTVATAGSIVNNIITCSDPILSVTNNTSNLNTITSFTIGSYSFNSNTIAGGLSKVTINTSRGNLQLPYWSLIPTATYYTLWASSYGTNSLTKKFNDLVLTATAGRTIADPSFLNVYSSGYTLNSNLYTKNIIDVSPFTDNGYSFGACLVTPRHVIGCAHASIAVGQTITFTDMNGGTQTKTVKAISYGLGVNIDLTVGYLDSAIDTTKITPYSVLPEDATTAIKVPMGTVSNNVYGNVKQGIYGFFAKKRYPLGGGDNIRQMQLGCLTSICGNSDTPAWFGNPGIKTPYTNYILNTNDIRYTYANPYNLWSSSLADGDSGSPTFLPTGLTTATGTPLTLYLGSQSTGAIASAVSAVIPQVNAAMNAIKDAGDTTTYALDQINISQSSWWNSFTSY